eukprot:Plantae.Rhodophyta-Purpureofilum_apyrenoidigerum.ctg64442.p1 GENE.Plantae.Rhodophyta-Purpureofilum_apyrenoidigerum.ctg64442~~Plantae.Rhodophyta-Purpureofilum_apyrenoidigerum.ctg64442.p1  ORF type:complete len:413 (+),score=104.28 Plantae.Rhodophyta-Purpureofilum_apyrenoidigerum.ctg64442:102-1340(+)
MAGNAGGTDGAPWSEDDLSRAVLVRNLPAAASESALEDFFSFCGDVETQFMFLDRQEAVVVFRDTDVQQSALLMNGGKLLDVPVQISAMPEGYTAEEGGEIGADEDDTGADGSVPVVDSEDILGDLPLRSKTVPASGGSNRSWFSSMKQTLLEVQQEYKEVAKEISDEYGVAVREFNENVKSTFDDVKLADTLAKAKSTAAESASATRARMAELDAKYDVSHSVSEAAQKGKHQAANISRQIDDKLGVSTAAVKVANVSKGLAREVDENYQLSERSRQLASKALDNDTIREGIRSISLSWSSFTSQFSQPRQPTTGSATETDTATATVEGASRADESGAFVGASNGAGTANVAEDGAVSGNDDDKAKKKGLEHSQAAVPPPEIHAADENATPVKASAPNAKPAASSNPLEVD